MLYIGIDISKNFYVAAVIVKGKSRVQKFPEQAGFGFVFWREPAKF